MINKAAMVLLTTKAHRMFVQVTDIRQWLDKLHAAFPKVSKGELIVSTIIFGLITTIAFIIIGLIPTLAGIA
jgi:hypothetical protein